MTRQGKLETGRSETPNAMMIGGFNFELVISGTHIGVPGHAFAGGFLPFSLNAVGGESIAESRALWIHKRICRIMKLEHLRPARGQSHWSFKIGRAHV